MTIKQLIEELQKLPPYAQVLLGKRPTPPDSRDEVHHVIWHGGYVELTKR